DPGDDAFRVRHILLIVTSKGGGEHPLLGDDAVEIDTDHRDADYSQCDPVARGENRAQPHQQRACIAWMPDQTIGSGAYDVLSGLDTQGARVVRAEDAVGPDAQCDATDHQRDTEPG